ncbi:aminotransferase class I/II-fold pyridoxal phosphate-dependent enzyme [Sphingomonas histidinilytica]|uniref:amino acid aminotransferase n=1 Tax=Rhizorhabdus histidinilytica TaxID=439228 RepID=UPI001ADB2293|nr:amino acid aminotransferase [Rhizorhabdus histidinilytica]MBO9378682.1 aminotransferase class I/II-fold pyridoxal phosphate-dependent enzyme [Rhizorhabdus histidinilytica]
MITLDETTVAPPRALLGRLELQPSDSLLALIGMYAADPRANKIDLGVGVYKDEAGHTPVFTAVKAAEAKLLAEQPTKAYVGPEGDIGFFEGLAPILFGEAAPRARLAGLQTPGGTGALRLGAELIARNNPDAMIHVGGPTWPNHAPIFAATRLSLRQHRHIDLVTQELCFDDVLSSLQAAVPGDAVLLHGCCHNPTGADFTIDQWEALGALMAKRGLLPFIDLAYQGLGASMDEDAAGVRIVARHCPELLVAYSCDKNFGLYRERVGALFVLAAEPEAAAVVQSNLLSLARANWSMPPDHGAAVVRLILESVELRAQWLAELDEVRTRIAAMRTGLAALDPALAFIGRQKGMFSTLPLSPDQVKAMREQHAIYMAGSGRINIAGLTPAKLAPLAAAFAAVR